MQTKHTKNLQIFMVHFNLACAWYSLWSVKRGSYWVPRVVITQLWSVSSSLRRPSLLVLSRCQAKFLTSAKFLSCYFLSVVLLLRIKK